MPRLVPAARVSEHLQATVTDLLIPDCNLAWVRRSFGRLRTPIGELA
jgi:hypothetical protein